MNWIYYFPSLLSATVFNSNFWKSKPYYNPNSTSTVWKDRASETDWKKNEWNEKQIKYLQN